jgi:hypothetical protein
MLVVCGPRDAVNLRSVWCYDDYGILKWTYDTGGQTWDCVTDKDNNVYIVGDAANNGDGHGTRNCWKLDREGNYLTGAQIGALITYACVHIDINNTNLYIASAAACYRTDHNFGNISAAFGSTSSAIRVDTEGNIYVGSGGTVQVSLTKYNSSLVSQWTESYPAYPRSNVNSIDFFASGNVVVGIGTFVRCYKADGSSASEGEWAYSATGTVYKISVNGDDEVCAVVWADTYSFIVLNNIGELQGYLNKTGGLQALFLDSADIPYVAGVTASSYNVWKVNLPAYTLAGLAYTGSSLPGQCGMYGDGIAGATIAPTLSNVWLSKVGDYDNFEEGVNDDDSFSLAITTQNKVRWIDALEALLIGTTGDEWRIASSKLETPLTPTNFTIRQQTEHGSAHIQPVRANSSLLFVDFVKRKVRELTYSASDEKYTAPDMTSLAEHITYSGITSIARQKNPESIVWMTLDDGSLISMTYERDQNVIAWSKHPLGGDGFCQSVCVLPGTTEDEVYLSVKRTIAGTQITYEGELVTYEGEQVTINGGEHIYIEKMAPRVFTAIEDAFFVDCGITFTSETATSTITGLDHLEGETVKVLGDGVVLDDEVVSGGQITAHLAGVETTVLKAQVGLDPEATLQPLRIVMDSNNGSSMGSTTRVGRLMISFLNTGAAKYGIKETEMYDIDFTDPRWTNTCEIDGLFTGEVVVSMPGGYNPLNPIFIKSDGPMPLTVRCLVPDIAQSGR